MIGKGTIYIAILALLITSSSVSAEKEDAEKGSCCCGIFASKEAKEEDQPLISKSYINVSCNNNGTQMCFALCTSLAKASKERATQALCQNIEQVDNLIASLYTKTCNDKWTYAGITTDEPICCHDKKIADCKTTKKP